MTRENAWWMVLQQQLHSLLLHFSLLALWSNNSKQQQQRQHIPVDRTLPYESDFHMNTVLRAMLQTETASASICWGVKVCNA
jgi:hypothetical protein